MKTDLSAPWASPFIDLPFDPWPAVLPRTSADPVAPFAIGLADDLLLRLPEERWPTLRHRLKWYCSSRLYLTALAGDAGWRHDVDGNRVAPVGDVDRLAAAIRLLEITIRKGSANVKAEAAPLVEQAKMVVRERANAKAPAGRVDQGGRPILSRKQT
jgi:sRNA-binding protein